MVPYKVECFFYFCEKWHSNIDKDCIESVYHFGEYGYFNNINSSNPYTWAICQLICGFFFNSFHQCRHLFSVDILYLDKFIIRHFIGFGAISEIAFLILILIVHCNLHF